jgi:hypothetical protein
MATSFSSYYIALHKNSPVLVESSSALLGQMFCPDRLECPHSMRGLDVTNDSDNHDGRSFDDGHGLDNFLLIDLGSWTVNQAADVRHPGLWESIENNY